MADIQRPRGTRDFRPEDMEIRRSAESLMRGAFELVGYREISTPIFEQSELFVIKSGPQVLDQMYTFKDKGGRDLALRPELTAPVMRFYSSDLKNDPKPIRIYYFGNCFRYERPQKGRFREFWQLGLEYIGKRTPLAVTEVILSAVSALRSVGLQGFEVRVGHVALLSTLLSKWDIDPVQDKELMIAIDKKDGDSIISLLERKGDHDPEGLSNLLTLTYDLEEAGVVLKQFENDYGGLIEEPIREIREVLNLLSQYGDVVKFDPSISRGLDYYDGTVFEIDMPSLGAEKQICGGGAYSLSTAIGAGIEGIGFGLGFDRIIIALEDQWVKVNEDDPKFYLIPMGVEAEGLAMASRIRDRGFCCMVETSGRSFKKAINTALSEGCDYLIVMGEDEVRTGTVTIKDLDSKEQLNIEIDSLDSYLDGL